MSRITYGYKRRQHDTLMTSLCVIDKIENNPFFPKPPAALAKLKKAAPAFQKALANALGRDKHLVAVKDEKKELVLALLQELARYVLKVSNGDRTIILSSGFDTTKERRKTWIPPVIEQLEVTLGGPGVATTLAKKVSGVKGYMHEYATEQPGKNTEWFSAGSTLKKYTFDKLQSGKRYWFRVVGIGTRKRQGYSPIVSVVIQ